jgi:uncharacterized protein
LTKSIIGLFTLSLLSVLAGVYSHGLQQKNPETLFLTKEGIREYKNFNKLIPENKNLVIGLDYIEKPTFSEYLEKKRFFIALKQKYSETFEIILPENQYRHLKHFKEALEKDQFPHGPLKLTGKRHLAFLIIEKDINSSFNNIIDQVAEAFPQAKMAGIPYTNYLLDRYSKAISEKVFPIMFGISFLLILLLTFSLRDSILIFLPCFYTALISLSVIKLIYQSMNMVTSIIPLMAFAINLSIAFHLYFTMINEGSFRLAIKKKLTPFLLMIFTTAIGFGSLYVAEIKAISEFGALSSALILTTSFFTLLWFCFVEGLFKNAPKVLKLPLFSSAIFSKSLSIKTIFLFSFLTVIITLPIIPKINVITDATRYFPKATGLKIAMDNINEKVVGLPLYQFIFSFEKDLEIEKLKEIEVFENKLKKRLLELKSEIKIFSMNSVISENNRAYSGMAKIPSQMLSYATLRSRLPTTLKESFPLSNKYKISLLGKSSNVGSYTKILDQLEIFVAENFQYPYLVNGLYYNLMVSQKEMIKVLTKSFLFALLIVSFIAYLYVRKKRIFFIFLFVNIIPVFISLIFLYLFNFSLNIATIMTYSISIGIIVDSSFHIIHSLERKEGNGFEEYFKTTIVPIIGSSALLVLSFSLFGFNQFLPIKQFGLNLSLILALGLIFDLFVLPTLYLGHSRVKEVLNEGNL